jgi:hypothetical protein
MVVTQKTWLPGGGTYFLYMCYMGILENLLLQIHWADLNEIWHGWFLGDPLPRLFNL